MANTELPTYALSYILERYLRAHLFNNHNKAPEKIIVPRITSISIYVGRDEQLTVPVELEKEEPIDTELTQKGKKGQAIGMHKQGTI